MRLSFWRDWMDKVPFRAKAETKTEVAPAPVAAPAVAAPVAASVPAARGTRACRRRDDPRDHSHRR